MKWFIKCLKQYADFKGRARRKEYIMYCLFYTIIYVSLYLLDGYLGTLFSTSGGLCSFKNFNQCDSIGIFSGIFSLILLCPSLAVAVRRFHDIDKSAWYLIYLFIPIVNIVFGLRLLFEPSDYLSNDWGDCHHVQ